MARIDISFKNTSRDMEVYNYWFNLEDRSAEIKEVLRVEMKKRKSKNNIKATNADNVEKVTKEVDVFNF